jgi:hypothetical protein
MSEDGYPRTVNHSHACAHDYPQANGAERCSGRMPGVPADMDPSQNRLLGPNPLANMDRGVHIR